MLVTDEGMVMLVKPVQSKNARSLMLVTDEGMVVVLQPATRVLLAVSIIALQLLRESYFVLRASTLMLVKPVQPENAELPMLVTDEGMVMLVKPLQSLNAFSPMLCTSSPSIYSFTWFPKIEDSVDEDV